MQTKTDLAQALATLIGSLKSGAGGQQGIVGFGNATAQGGSGGTAQSGALPSPAGPFKYRFFYDRVPPSGVMSHPDLGEGEG